MGMEMESKETNKVKVIIELVQNGAILDYPDIGFKCITKSEHLADDLGRDIIAEMNEYSHHKYLVEINITPI